MKKKWPNFGKSEQLLTITFSRPDFQKKIEGVRLNCGIPLQGFTSKKEDATWEEEVLDGSGKRNILNHEINKLLINFKLPENVRYQIENFIKFNQHGSTENVGITSHYDKKLKRDRLFLEIFNDTSLEDIETAWSRVISLKKHLADFRKNPFRPISNLEVEKLAYESRQKGMKFREIAVLIEQEKQVSCSENYASKLVKRYKQRINK